MRDQLKAISIDPFDSDAKKYMHIQSTKYDAVDGFTPWILPSAANFPDALSGTPTRLVYDCPFFIDASDLDDTRPITIYDTTAAAALTRVTTAPASGEYRVVTYALSLRKCALEFNVDAAGHTIDYDFYSWGSVITAEAINTVFTAFNFLCDITGIVPSNNGSDVANDIDFTSGYCLDSTKKVVLTAGAITKKLDATFVAGTNQGMLDTGSKANSTVYYIFEIGKTADPAANDKLASTSSSSPSMPSGWDLKRLIGIIQTDGSGNIYRGMWWREGNKLCFRFRTFITDRAEGVIGTPDARKLLTTTAPINSYGIFLFSVFNGDTFGSQFSWGATFEEDIDPSGNFKMDLVSDYGIKISAQDNIFVDNNRQIYYRSSNSDNTYLKIMLIGYYYIL